MEILLSRIQSPGPAPPSALVVVNLPLAQNATGWGGLRGCRYSHRPLGKSLKCEVRAWSWRTSCLGRPGVLDGGGSGHGLLSSTHPSQLSWELRAPGAGVHNCLVTQEWTAPCALLPPHPGPPSPRLRLPEEQIPQRGVKVRLIVPRIPGRPGGAAREEGWWGCDGGGEAQGQTRAGSGWER